MRDRYGNNVTTNSHQAFDAYCDGIDRFLAAQAGAIEALTLATELDPQFALAHADLARALQIVARPKDARRHMALATEQSSKLTAADQQQEFEHLQIMELLVAGKSAEAFARIKTHAQDFPRDVMTVQPCCGVFGLIGFSGRDNREAENAEFMAGLHRHYKGDWWFDSQYAFALAEIGELSQAETLNEQAYLANPDNANAVHHRAHIHYEIGEDAAGRIALNEWRKDYSRDGLLHCHLAWHDALWALASNEPDELWHIVEADILPTVTTAPPINVMTDLVAVLMRAQLAGLSPPQGLWSVASDYAQASFPKPGVSFADAHSVIAYAVTNVEGAIDPFKDSPRGWAGDIVEALARAFCAFTDEAWQTCLDELAPIMDSHQRLGGSRAQRDLIELTYSHAQRRLGQTPSSTRAQALR